MFRDLNFSPDESRAFIVILSTIFVAMLGVGIISPLLPIYAESLGASGWMLGLIFGGFSAVRALAMPVVGRWSDRHGRRAFLLVGLALYALLSFLYVRVDTAWGLVAVRTSHGIAAAMTLPVAAAYVGDIATTGHEGRAMSYFNLALLLGFGAGPLMGGILQDTLGFASTFIAMGSLAAVAGLFAARHLREPRERARRETVSVREALVHPSIRALLAFRLLMALGRGAVASFLPVYAATRLGLSATKIGVLISSHILLAGVLQPFGGRLADRVPRVPLMIVGATILSVALAAMGGAADFVHLLGCALGLALGGAAAMSAASAMAVVEGRRIGMGTMMGLFNTAMSVGIGVGALAAGAVADAVGLRAVFWTAGAATFAGSIACVRDLVDADAGHRAQAAADLEAAALAAEAVEPGGGS